MSDAICYEIGCLSVNDMYRSCNPKTCFVVKQAKDDHCPDCGVKLGKLPLHSLRCKSSQAQQAAK